MNMIKDKQTLIFAQRQIAELEHSILTVREQSITDADHAQQMIASYRTQRFVYQTEVDKFLGLQPADETDSIGTVVRRLTERVYSLEERLSDYMSVTNTSLDQLVSQLTAAEAAMKIREEGLEATLKTSIATLQTQVAALTTNDTDPAAIAAINAVIADLGTIATVSVNPPPTVIPLTFANTPPIAVDSKGMTLYAFSGTPPIDTSAWTESGVYADPAGVNAAGEPLYTFTGDTAPGQVNGVSAGWATVPQPTATTATT